MIGYFHIAGLTLHAQATVQLPQHGCMGEIAGLFGETYPSAEISLVPMTHAQCIAALKTDHLDESAFTFLGAYLRDKTDVQHAFMHFASLLPDGGSYPFAGCDFLVTALRLCFGACIDGLSWHCFFQPTEGPYHVEAAPAGAWRMREGRFDTFRTFDLRAEQIDKLNSFLVTLERWRPTIASRTELQIALRHLNRSMTFEQNVYQPRFEDHILSATIALEALLSPSNSNELKFRIAQSAANLVGRDGDERERVFAIVSAAYDIRSLVAHGTYADLPKKYLKATSTPNARELAHRVRDVVRESFARLTELMSTGESRGTILRDIERLGRRSLHALVGLQDDHFTAPHPVYDRPVLAGLPAENA